MFERAFVGRIVPFDSEAAIEYGHVVNARQLLGRSTAPFDMLIAAVARAHQAIVVTRDVRGFEGCGLELVDPWTQE